MMFQLPEQTVSASVWIVLLVFVLMVYGLVRLTRPRTISDEEFEREARRPSLLRTGLQELQGFLEPEKRASIQALRREKRKTKNKLSGDRPDAGAGDPRVES
jgi:hypothetical protein